MPALSIPSGLIHLSAFCGLVLLVPSIGVGQKEDLQPSVSFKRQVAPLLKKYCIECHGADGPEAELNLSSIAGIRAGGESGPIVVAGKENESQLLEVLREGRMPPDDRPGLSSDEMDVITAWVAHPAELLATPDPRVTQHDVLPVLYLRCATCHGSREQKAGLNLTTVAGLLKGGDSGPAVVVGDPDSSPLVRRIEAGEMPPPEHYVAAGVRPVEPAERDLIRRWIAEGLTRVSIAADVATTEPDSLVTNEDRSFWSFQAPRPQVVPQHTSGVNVENPIDAFLLDRLSDHELHFAALADRRVLIRRVSFDLTGLPPTVGEVEAFLTDTRPGAYSRMVDRYLASPAFGEHQGRYWLDLVGYADSEGKRSADPIRPHAWRYRDYVIQAFNADKSYSRFLLEQIAGDELQPYPSDQALTPEQYDNLVATGFLRMAPDGTGSDIVNTVAERLEVMSDQIDILSTTVMGLTIKCAQCHSHKYDPIPQRDYYRLLAVFKGAFDEHDWLKPSFVAGQTKAKTPGRVLRLGMASERDHWQALRDQADRRTEELEDILGRRRKELTDRLITERLENLEPEQREAVQTARQTSVRERSDEQKSLLEQYRKQIDVSDKQLDRADPEFRKLRDSTDKAIKKLQSDLPAEPAIRALWDRGQPSPTYVYRRGEYTNPGRLVGPGVPSVLTDGKTPFEVSAPWPGSNKTGRRLAFARWLIEPSHPLTARVIVNRLWKQHFGRGIVESDGNFGTTGTEPSHQELLDWLAIELIQRDFSLKALHRLILNSRAYKQSSRPAEKTLRLDPANLLLGRMPVRRLQAEAIRDALLAVSGELNRSMYGRPDPVQVREDGLVMSDERQGGLRRAVYVQQRRKEIPTMLEVFDLPQMIPNCVERPSSTVASQALLLWNSEQVRIWSERLADRIRREAGLRRKDQVKWIYRTVLGRDPDSEEMEIGIDYLKRLSSEWQVELRSEKDPQKTSRSDPDRLALANYCHVIMNSAEFLYVD